MPTAPTSAPELIELIRKSGVVTPERLAELAAMDLPSEPHKAAAALVSAGILTRFQAQQLLAGRHKGFRLGPYIVRDLLGRGGMGAVYLAEHKELHRKVAVKVLVPSKDEDQMLALERFIREARAAAALDHPNIVRIFDVARHNEVPYLVMEYVEGDTLQALLDRRGPIPYPTATDYIAQAAAGLQHAHEKGFIHRDIKPGNLMLDKTGTVKILDMGLARSANPQDKLTERLDHGAVVGTADFIAPEQALNQPAIDGRADIYSLGATFFALLAGKPPFEGNTTQKLLQHQLRSAPRLTTLDPSLPQELCTVVAKMLAKKPADRYQTAAEVITALTPWVGHRSHVLMGISRTSLAQDGDLQATLSGLSHGDPARRSGSVAGSVDCNGSDSGRVDPFESGRETSSVASSTTRREPRSPERFPRRQVMVFASTGVMLLAAGALAGWLAFVSSREAPAPLNSDPQPQPKPVAPNSDPRTEPKDEPPTSTEKVLFNLAAVDLPPFQTTRKGFDTTAGDEIPPIRGVTFGAPQKQAISQWTCGPVDGRQAISLTNLNDGTSSGIGIELEQADGLGLKVDPGRQLRLRVTYRTTGTGHGTAAILMGDGQPLATAALANSNDTWKTVDVVATRGDQPVRCAINATGHGTGNTLSIRTINVTDLGKADPPVSDSDPATWVEGSVVYSLDLAKVPPFRVIKEQFIRTAGEPEVLPPGVACQAWREGSVGEFRSEKLDGVPVLTVANLAGERSAQFCFELESEMKLPLQPGKAYRVKIGYRTANDGIGAAHVQVTPGYKTIATTLLPGTGGRWKNASVLFVRPPASDNVQVRFVIDNTWTGENNTLSIRSVQIVELVPPVKK